MFYNNGYNQDWSTLKKLIWLRGNPATGQMGTDLTVSGTPPLSLPNSLGKPLKAWSVDVLPYQEGSGDPSPDNVRAIHGTNQISFVTSGENLASDNIDDWENGQSYFCYHIPVEGRGTISISDKDTSADISGIYFGVSYTTSSQGGYIDWLVTNGAITKTSTGRLQQQYISIYPNTQAAFNAVFSRFNVMLNMGNTTLPYVPYLAPSQTVIDVPPLSANQWDEEWEIGGINLQTGEPTTWSTVFRMKNKLRVQGGTAYYFCCQTAQSDVFRICWYDANETFIESNGRPMATNNVITAPSNAAYCWAYFANIGTTYNHDISINYPSTVTTYNPYSNTVYTGTIGSEGGESRSAMVDMGDLEYILSGTGASYSAFVTYSITLKAPTSGADVIHAICTELKSLSYGAYWTSNSIAPHSSASNYMRVILPTTVTTAQECKAYVSGMKLVYELATPTSITLPTPTIPTPTGTATTWATAEDGIVDSMEVTYVGKA